MIPLPDAAHLEALAHRRAAEAAGLALERGVTVAAAESLTGGLVLGTLADVPGVSAVLRGGVVAYATQVKAELLGVDAELLARGGAVQAEVARQMARGVSDRLSADFAVATTGVAGPDPQDGHPPGTVHIAVHGPNGDRSHVRDGEHRWQGDRAQIRWASVLLALSALWAAMDTEDRHAEEDQHSDR